MPSYLFRRVARSMGIVALICLSLATAASLVRLLPWLTSAQVPWRASAVFSLALALAALEVALLIAPAVGASLEIARCTSDGSLVALQSVGFGPPRMLRQIGQAALIAAALSSAAAAFWGWQANRPGLLSNQILSAGSTSPCQTHAAAQVPLGADLAWLCVDHRPVLVGRLGAGVYSAANARFSDDLSTLSAEDVSISTRAPAMNARFGSVTVTGFVPWLVASSVPALFRALACALACLASTLAASWVLLRRPTPSRAAALAIGSAGPVAFLALAPGLLARDAAIGSAACMVLAGAAPLIAGAGLSPFRRIAGSLSRGRTGRGEG